MARKEGPNRPQRKADRAPAPGIRAQVAIARYHYAGHPAQAGRHRRERTH